MVDKNVYMQGPIVWHPYYTLTILRTTSTFGPYATYKALSNINMTFTQSNRFRNVLKGGKQKASQWD